MYKRVLFIGSKNSGLKVLKEMYNRTPQELIGCVTIDDSEDTRSELSGFLDFCKKKELFIDVLTGKGELTEVIEKLQPDLCFVMGWYFIINEELLSRVRGGFIGIHNSLLPAHRGFAPVVWSIIAGDEKTGFSVFSFDKGMDTGDIWYQGIVDINESDYISDILEKIDVGIETFFEEKYVDIVLENIIPQKQIEKGVSYGAKRIQEDGRIDWSRNSKEIYNFVRAQSKPYPGAFSTYREQKIILWNVELFPHKIQGKPGQIGLINEGEVIVICGNDTGVKITKIEINGEEKNVTEVIKSINYLML